MPQEDIECIKRILERNFDAGLAQHIVKTLEDAPLDLVGARTTFSEKLVDIAKPYINKIYADWCKVIPVAWCGSVYYNNILNAVKDTADAVAAELITVEGENKNDR